MCGDGGHESRHLRPSSPGEDVEHRGERGAAYGVHRHELQPPDDCRRPEAEVSQPDTEANDVDEGDYQKRRDYPDSREEAFGDEEAHNEGRGRGDRREDSEKTGELCLGVEGEGHRFAEGEDDQVDEDGKGKGHAGGKLEQRAGADRADCLSKLGERRDRSIGGVLDHKASDRDEQGRAAEEKCCLDEEKRRSAEPGGQRPGGQIPDHAAHHASGCEQREQTLCLAGVAHRPGGVPHHGESENDDALCGYPDDGVDDWRVEEHAGPGTEHPDGTGPGDQWEPAPLPSIRQAHDMNRDHHHDDRPGEHDHRRQVLHAEPLEEESVCGVEAQPVSRLGDQEQGCRPTDQALLVSHDAKGRESPVHQSPLRSRIHGPILTSVGA